MINEVNKNIIDIIDEKTKKQLIIHRNIYGEDFVTDLRPTAGQSAQKSGALFEKIVLRILDNYNVYKNYSIRFKPVFICHFDLDREGDFLLKTKKRDIHIECKQLGNLESHFDKLSHCLMNVISGCYGEHFWLIYDFNRDKFNNKKLKKLVERCNIIKEQVALQGITFECILVDELPNYLKILNND